MFLEQLLRVGLSGVEMDLHLLETRIARIYRAMKPTFQNHKKSTIEELLVQSSKVKINITSPFPVDGEVEAVPAFQLPAAGSSSDTLSHTSCSASCIKIPGFIFAQGGLL